MKKKTGGDVRILAAKAVLPRLEALRRGIPGTRAAEDVESLHQMRVASRRLRSTLGMFERSLGKNAKRWRREVRSITGILGAARDLDVQIDLVEEFLAPIEDPDLRRGPRLLLDHLVEERSRAQVRVDGALDRLESSGLLDEIRRELFPIASGADAQVLRALRPLRHKWARDAVRAAVKELLQYRRYVARPECIEELHEMRIAAKRLRYVLEAFVPYHREELEGTLSTARSLQEILGDIHDCDIWEAVLAKVLKKSRLGGKEIALRAVDLPGIRSGLELLREDRGRRRKKRYRRLLRLWKDIEGRGIWKKLLKSLRRA